MSSPLDRIEAGARARLGRKGGATLEAHDLLALVSIARAAENHLDSTDLVLGDCDIAHLELTVGPLREALSRLGNQHA